MHENIKDKLLERIDQLGICWLWTGAVDKNGYGLFRVEGKTRRVARIWWELLYSVKLFESQHVLHRCDTPSCMNPDHLFLGTHAQNMADMAAKRRANRPIGELNGRSRLTALQAAEIKEKAAQGKSQSQLADEYAVSRGAIYHVLAGRTWN